MIKIRARRYYGFFKNVTSLYYVWGSNDGKSLELYRSEDRTAGPLGRARPHVNGGWRITWYILEDASGQWNERFKARLAEFMEADARVR